MMRINATGGPEALPDTLVNVKFSSTGWTPDDKVCAQAIAFFAAPPLCVALACMGEQAPPACWEKKGAPGCLKCGRLNGFRQMMAKWQPRAGRHADSRQHSGLEWSNLCVFQSCRAGMRCTRAGLLLQPLYPHR